MCQFCCLVCKEAEHAWVFNSSGTLLPMPGENGAKVNQLLHVKLLMTGWTGFFNDFKAGYKCRKNCEGLCKSRGKRSFRTVTHSFGGHALSEMSGKLDMLVIGNDPSLDKIQKAQNSIKIVVVTIQCIISL